MRTFFISDPHFGHGGLIEYASRLLQTTDEMDAIVENWNRVPGNHDRRGMMKKTARFEMVSPLPILFKILPSLSRADFRERTVPFLQRSRASAHKQVRKHAPPVNVCLENTGYAPILFDAIYEIVHKRLKNTLK